MKRTQSGFTLIELVVVIVLLGILGVTALARFQDLSSDAASAATQGIASELGSAAAINYAEGLIDGDYTVTLTVDPVCTTAILQELFQSTTWPTGYTVAETDAAANSGDCTGGAGNTATCDITHTSSSQSATATLICGG